MKTLRAVRLLGDPLRDQHRGGAAGQAHQRAASDIFPQARIYSMYGLTECKRCTYLPPEDIDRKPDERRHRHPQHRAVDRRRGRQPARRRRRSGQLVIRGATVMQGYWEKPEATREEAAPGAAARRDWCSTPATTAGSTTRATSTSSAAWTTSSSRAARRSRPKEVENALVNIPGVKEAAVIGVPDEHPRPGGEGVRGARAGRRRSTEKDIQQRVPEAARELHGARSTSRSSPELPKTTTGKIKKTDLR